MLSHHRAGHVVPPPLAPGRAEPRARTWGPAGRRRRGARGKSGGWGSAARGRPAGPAAPGSRGGGSAGPAVTPSPPPPTQRDGAGGSSHTPGDAGRRVPPGRAGGCPPGRCFPLVVICIPSTTPPSARMSAQPAAVFEWLLKYMRGNLL